MSKDKPIAPLPPPELQELFDAEKRRPDPPPQVKQAVFSSIAATLGIPDGGGGDGGSGAPPEGDSGAATGPGPDPGGAADPGSLSAPPMGDVSAGMDLGHALGAATGAGAAGAGVTGGGAAGGGVLLTAVLKPVTVAAFVVGAATGAGTTAVVQTVMEPDRAAQQVPVERTRLRPPPPLAAAPIPDAGTARADLAVAPDQRTPAPAAPPLHRTKRNGSSARRSGPDGPAAPAPAKLDAGAIRRATAFPLERLLIERARIALARGEPAAALEALEQCRSKFPGGFFADNREALRVVALSALGKDKLARQSAQHFKRRFPKSPFREMVDSAVSRPKETKR